MSPRDASRAFPGAFLPVGHPGGFDGRGVRRGSEESAHEDQAQHLPAGVQDFQETLQDAWMGKAIGKNWVCLKMGYTPNYSHLVGIMIINHWV